MKWNENENENENERKNTKSCCKRGWRCFVFTRLIIWGITAYCFLGTKKADVWETLRKKNEKKFLFTSKKKKRKKIK